MAQADASTQMNNPSVTEAAVLDALRQVIDPEMGCNLVDLGLIYDVAITGAKVKVTMTLATPGCPMHESLCSGVQVAAESGRSGRRRTGTGLGSTVASFDDDRRRAGPNAPCETAESAGKQPITGQQRYIAATRSLEQPIQRQRPREARSRVAVV